MKRPHIHRLGGGVHEMIEAIDQGMDAGLTAEFVVMRHGNPKSSGRMVTGKRREEEGAPRVNGAKSERRQE